MTALRLDRDQIAARIPHAGRMCLLDRLEAWDDTTIHCSSRSHLAADHPLAIGGQLMAPCAIEYAAQAMALHGGLLQEAERGAGQAPTAGFIASVRNVRFFALRLDQVPGPLQVRAERLSGDAQQVLYGFEVSNDGGALLVSGRAVVVLNTPIASIAAIAPIMLAGAVATTTETAPS